MLGSHAASREMATGSSSPLCRAFAPTPRMRGLLNRIRDCNDGADKFREGRTFIVDGHPVGVVLPIAAKELARFPKVFTVSPTAVELAPDLGTSPEARSAAVGDVLQTLRKAGVPMLKGWRDEAWPVKTSFDAPESFVVERASAPIFGIRAYGCHLNGLTGSSGKLDEDCLWVARRSKTKATYPGKLDHLVAGGLGNNEKPSDNIVRECYEEASIPAEISEKARPAGLISYIQQDESEWGLKRDVIFCYDLDLPKGFKPIANDGEVESFDLWDIEKVINSLASDSKEWKPNVALVIIDMLIRRGYLTPEESGYVELVGSLRQ